MTTRSLTIVKDKKEWTKADISWYDGYPSYVGVRVLKKIRKDLNKYRNLTKLISEKDIKGMLDSTYASWLYVIDLDTNKFEIYSRNYTKNKNFKIDSEFSLREKFNLDALPTPKEFLNKFI